MNLSYAFVFDTLAISINFNSLRNAFEYKSRYWCYHRIEISMRFNFEFRVSGRMSRAFSHQNQSNQFNYFCSMGAHTSTNTQSEAEYFDCD